MIYLFTGDDAKNKILSYEKFIKSLPKGGDKFSVSRNNFDKIQIESLYSGSSLFSAKAAVIFSGILENEETRDFILEKLELIGESTSDFIFLEGKLNKPILDAFKKVGPKRLQMNVFELPKEKKEKFNNFLLANAFEQKDKLNLWIYFRQAMDRGVGMEELVGVLFWKVKDMLIKKNFGKFKELELKNFASKISYILPEARKTGRDAEASFEQFLLEVF
ncbi:hypothetical protein A2W67_01065 [Candidatus Nomurabacteria bacterium RIFCSPLOWO2_02_40_28]|uniref:DNA polymerase III delta N-terminal domain-containing protein n=2 Tax=Candidatus Nomuraibacteriota TaxID=1752729 RepID=A0A837HTZ5_9BACT|nr:MAG: hypothetical protein UT27_C0001G0041 [Candidatus Nomurabacteria bacterium GW2011_GWD2_39_12]KKR20692.1 MAG: hypothetical protein UT51_C0002G0127 [Candidatus Nomurabacteria bacterium GW2011_GWC2_39_41]KKR37380.1 MAG: hypothetical protein UT70_C0001G0056 [Candidatus Nomurabacteria bacterium GW2011_GWE2_40_10]KKR38627.1 MAG: hypothetical protein UT73_C0002G0112 [Candidatus Nomurabacteria bacterium GW2011_GWB1_40_11]KKR40352.1 MAG: hypothetical protein UT74_C0001G0086 [Parcubacteria group b